MKYCGRNFALLMTLLMTMELRAAVFTGRIQATVTRGGQTMSLLYTAGTNWLRVESTDGNRPTAVDLLDRQSRMLTLVFPNNRTFVHLPPLDETAGAAGSSCLRTPPGGLPPGIGPRSDPDAANLPAMAGGIAPMPGMAIMPPGGNGMPNMPMPPMEIFLKATAETTNLLGFACVRYEGKQAAESIEIWATDQLIPFQAWQPAQRPKSLPPMLEEQWPGILKAKNLFPVRVSLKFANGAEQYHFEVKSITPQTFAQADAHLFQLPADYREIQPLPF